jgi:GINS complex subunit 3
MNYYDIDDILMQESRLKVRFNHRIRNFGFSPSEKGSHIPAGKKAEVPYFLVSFLLRNGHCTLAEELIDDTLLNDLKAKSSLVDLGSLCKYFFYLYSELLPEAGLEAFFLERMSDHSALVLKETFSENDAWRLDAVERKLIVKSRKTLQMFRRFFIGRPE